MTPYGMVKGKLDELNIEFELVEHEAALTTEQADEFIEGIEGVRTKTMFLTDKKKTQWFLLVMGGSHRLDMSRFEEITGAKRMKMASAESLMEKTGLTPGSVSIFGLLNNADHDINVYIEKAIVGEGRMSFHPNDNTKTIFISTEDMFRFFESIGYEAKIADL
ncbi:MAG: prolyl-tRNA synthetase associated domain-containing protein [Firmicutes bacterium]|nr:prolyl-tRNA synthetase associated domain-containing protein [Bacillota bacterium]